MKKYITSQDFKIALILTPNGIDAITVLNNDPNVRRDSFHICSLLSDCFLNFEKTFIDKYKNFTNQNLTNG
jgi:hypothetical protein